MLLPGIGFTSASCTPYISQNGVKKPGTASPGSSQAGASVTYSANRISPSGLPCATAGAGRSEIVAAASRQANTKVRQRGIVGVSSCLRRYRTNPLQHKPKIVLTLKRLQPQT